MTDRVFVDTNVLLYARDPSECAVLLTKDLQHGMTMSGVRVQSPFVLAVNEAISVRPRSRPSRMRVRIGLRNASGAAVSAQRLIRP